MKKTSSILAFIFTVSIFLSLPLSAEMRYRINPKCIRNFANICPEANYDTILSAKLFYTKISKSDIAKVNWMYLPLKDIQMTIALWELDMFKHQKEYPYNYENINFEMIFTACIESKNIIQKIDHKKESPKWEFRKTKSRN